MLEYGVRGHDFGRMTALELGEAIAARGIAWVQLALAKALTTPDCRTGNLSPGLAKRIAGDLGRSGVGIAVLGCYINPVDEDAGAREAGLARFREHLRYARDFGCPLVATETGWRGRSEVAIQPLGPCPHASPTCHM